MAEDQYEFLAPPQAPDELGRLGGYRILKLLGEGGMGMVFQAEDVQLRRFVALKVMKPDIAKDSVALQRFLREARSAAAVKHDHVITIYQVAEDRGVPFLAMEFLHGEPLDKWLSHRKPTLPQTLKIGREIADGLAAAHGKGLIHRDIKPANIWLEAPRGRVKILDFGLARANKVDDSHLTMTGTILGTPAFMSPEQAASGTVDVRSDLFSLGVVLYRLCTGKMPFEGRTVTAVLSALLTKQPRPPRELNPELPLEFSALIMQLLAKKSEDRPQSAQEVVEAIRRCQPKKTKDHGNSAPLSANKHQNRGTEETLSSTADWREIPGYRPADSTVVTSLRQGDGPLRSLPGSLRRIPLWVLAAAAATGIIASLTIVLMAFRGDQPEESRKAAVKSPPEKESKQKVARSALLTAPFDAKTAKAAQEQWAKHLGKKSSVTTNSIGMKLVVIPPGKFMMGSPEDGQVQVTLTQPYLLGAYEVTQKQWQDVMGDANAPWKDKMDVKKGADFAASYISWDDAMKYCKRLSEKERKAGRLPDGWEYTLPTEAQWEYACRAGTTSNYSFGDDPRELGKYAWFEKNTEAVGESHPHEVGRKLPNAFGLYDMHGNVWELCRDWYGEKLRGGTDPVVTEKPSKLKIPARVIRGASWLNPSEHCRLAIRGSGYGIGYGVRHNGFRVALVPSSTAVRLKKDSEYLQRITSYIGDQQRFKNELSNYVTAVPGTQRSTDFERSVGNSSHWSAIDRWNRFVQRWSGQDLNQLNANQARLLIAEVTNISQGGSTFGPAKQLTPFVRYLKSFSQQVDDNGIALAGSLRTWLSRPEIAKLWMLKNKKDGKRYYFSPPKNPKPGVKPDHPRWFSGRGEYEVQYFTDWKLVPKERKKARVLAADVDFGAGKKAQTFNWESPQSEFSRYALAQLDVIDKQGWEVTFAAIFAKLLAADIDEILKLNLTHEVLTVACKGSSVFSDVYAKHQMIVAKSIGSGSFDRTANWIDPENSEAVLSREEGKATIKALKELKPVKAQLDSALKALKALKQPKLGPQYKWAAWLHKDVSGQWVCSFNPKLAARVSNGRLFILHKEAKQMTVDLVQIGDVKEGRHSLDQKQLAVFVEGSPVYLVETRNNGSSP